MALPSSKSTKNDLLVRVRYPHNLPSPPFPPKLLTIDSNPHRFCGQDFLKALEDERELPMVADVELGMPLEVGRANLAYWETALDELPEGDYAALDPADKELLYDPSTAQTGSEVWKAENLRRNDSGAVTSEPLRREKTVSHTDVKTQDRSREGRIRTINKIFDHAHIPLEQLRHPTKKHLKAVETYPLLPDTSTWPNDYNLVRFPDPPQTSVKSAKGSSPSEIRQRFSSALFRPIASDYDENPRVAYYLLPQQVDIDEEMKRTALAQGLDSAEELDQATRDYLTKKTASEYIAKRLQLPKATDADAEVVDKEAFQFMYARDYEATNEQQLKADFVVGLRNDGPSGEERAAYYSLIQTGYTLRKRRPNPANDDESIEFWDGIDVKVGGDNGADRRKAALEAIAAPL